jgi:hypothetical protein
MPEEQHDGPEDDPKKILGTPSALTGMIMASQDRCDSGLTRCLHCQAGDTRR